MQFFRKQCATLLLLKQSLPGLSLPHMQNPCTYKFASSPKNLTNFKPETPLAGAPSRVNACHVRPTLSVKEQESYIKRHMRCQGCTKNQDWSRTPDVMSEVEAVKEAARCYKCVDAPCQKGCSTRIDIKSFIYQIEKGNFYGAAKTILTDNPLGLSCGMLCPDVELCGKGCNAINSEGGAIKIARLQEFAVRMFKEMGVKQKLSPLAGNYQQKVALIGCGAASISCATFLARLGYRNVHIFEKKQYGGGIVAQEIPANRIPFHNLDWEIQQMQNLGVQVHYGVEIVGGNQQAKKTDTKGKTLDELRSEGFQAIFLGQGQQKPQKNIGDIYDPEKNIFNSKTFLPQVCEQTKQGMTNDKTNQSNIKLNGHVVVLGIGDTALDCARSAFRLGATRVSVVFRRGFNDLRAGDQLFFQSFGEGCNFIPYSLPKRVVMDEQSGKIKAIEFFKHLPQSNDPRKPSYQKTAEFTTLPCDYLITAFGCQIGEDWVLDGFCDKKTKLVQVSNDTQQHISTPWLFAGGDNVGRSYLVHAVSDGKVAAWNMHKYVQGIQNKEVKIPDTPFFPPFTTAIDDVDISIDVDGVKYENPFGLASAPACTSYPMIKRAFELGWGFAVVKTFCLDKDSITNISPRIFKGKTASTQGHSAFANIELISEKSAAYWCEGAKQLKKEFPNKVVIGSIMAGYFKEDWDKLVDMCNDAGFDALELNLSCPHGMTEKGMGRSCGENPKVIEQITRWTVARSKVPVYIKLTPNHGEVTDLAEAAMKGGAAGVTATNTFPSFMDPSPDGTPWPAVGPKQQTAYGGGCGDFLRPIALRKISEIARDTDLNKKLSILGTGGCVTADHAMSFFQYGASVIQISSAVMDQDLSIVENLITGVKANMYLAQVKALKEKGWVGQHPPNEFYKLPTGKVEFQEDLKTEQVPKLKNIIGQRLQHFEDITKMSKEIYVVPEINDKLCVNCGRCYLACLDSGYQAIDFPLDTHLPKILEDQCTGCGLCIGVCPIPGALYFVPRKTDYTVKRGIAPGDDCPKEHLQTFKPYIPTRK